jgi:hypothetical protein
MSIVAAELIAYYAGTPAIWTTATGDDTSSLGGAIDATCRVFFSTGDIAAADTVQVRSSGADTRRVNIIGRTVAGVSTLEQLLLNGTTPVTSTTTFQSISSVQVLNNAGTALTGSGTLTVTLQRTTGATVITAIGGTAATSTETSAVRLFRNATVPASGTTIRYEKIFWKNTHATLALLGAAVGLPSDTDTLSTPDTFALETSINGSTSIANRVTAPGAATAFSAIGATITLLTATGTADLAAGSAIGVWVKMTTVSTDAAQEATVTTQLDGSST